MATATWEDYATPDTIYMVKQIESEANPNPTDLELVKYLKATSLKPSHAHVLATPLFEISVITLYCDDLYLFSNDVHCSVTVVDNDLRRFVLFDNDYCDDRHVLFLDGDKLTIILENSKLNHPVWIPKFLSLKVLLVDRITMFELVDLWNLDIEPNVVYDKLHCLKLDSEAFGDVFVSFSYFRYATLASVDCRLEKIGETSGTKHVYADVSGTISARFKIRDQIRTRVLFDEQDGDLYVLDPAKLCWSLQLAIPAYSPLEILIDNLVINKEKIDTSGHNFKFEPYDDCMEEVEMVGQKWRFQLTVKWNHAYRSLPILCECDFAGDVKGSEAEIIFSDLEDSDSETSGQSSELIEASSQRRQEKRPRLHSNELPLTDVNELIGRVQPITAFGVSPLNLVEVFSIAVCPYADNLESSLLLCGRISCCDFYGEHEVFNVEKDKASLLYPHQTISLVRQYRCFTGLGISMRLDLNDNQGHEMSRGYLAWCDIAAPLWLDRRLCSVVRGKYGFAAVHYTLFSNASQARIAISFHSEFRYPHQVYGRIWARYTGYRYSTQYDRQYYQSLLFQKGKDEYVTLNDGNGVPLSKIVVPVPLDEALVVIADLKFVGSSEERLRGKVNFQAQESLKSVITAQPKEIGGHNHKLIVSVYWG